jgi:predicted nucleic acid-binding protein
MIRRCLPPAVFLSLFLLTTIRGEAPPAGQTPQDAASAHLFAVLRHQTQAEADPEKLSELVKLLGSADYQRRECASRDLVGIGRPALARLRLACTDPDLEVSRRAQACIDAIESSLDKHSAYVAVMQLLRQRPAGTTAVQFADLRRQRIRIGTMDLKIACIALANDALLVTANLRDYSQVPELRCENWLQP